MSNLREATLTKLLNELRTKGREYDIDEVMEKFLRSFTAQWRMYTIFISNSFDLTKLDLVELHVMLKTYELEMSQDSKLLNNAKKGTEASTQGAAFFAPSVATTNYIVTFPAMSTSTSSNIQSSSEQPRNEAFMANGPEFFDFIRVDLKYFHPEDLEDLDLSIRWQ
ncbi:hypothetical protein L1987_46119 [Smallanthus sonchifolius]|uniref:Uncharacterized protein n=1 Tax=Smallanthus sonchifolius TaxID=185202 RepID=A0ACB9FYN4_9ASTR|nr:hypothetical protein L1987_46119 [Smallanthus sonchifolius]